MLERCGGKEPLTLVVGVGVRTAANTVKTDSARSSNSECERGTAPSHSTARQSIEPEFSWYARASHCYVTNSPPNFTAKNKHSYFTGSLGRNLLQLSWGGLWFKVSHVVPARFLSRAARRGWKLGVEHSFWAHSHGCWQPPCRVPSPCGSWLAPGQETPERARENPQVGCRSPFIT